MSGHSKEFSFIELKKTVAQDVEEGELVTEQDIVVEWVKVHDLELTLREVLRHAVVYEYPCLHVR